MRTAAIIFVVIYSIFVLSVGNLSDKGMLLAILVLAGLLMIFYKYSNLARVMMRRYDELKRAVYTADELIGCITQLEQRKDTLESPQKGPGLDVNHAIGTLRRAKLRAGFSHTSEPSDDVIRYQQEMPATKADTDSLSQNH